MGRDFRTSLQQIIILDSQAGELIERRLEHQKGEAPAVCAAFLGSARIGMEVTGHSQLFEEILVE